MRSADTLMIFAAGRGTRMRDLTRDRPKPMIPVAGKPLIDHALDLAEAHGIGRAVVNTHYAPAPLEAHLAGRKSPRITLSPEEELLETGGGLRHALPHLGAGPVWTLNADAVWAGANPFATIGAELPAGAARLLLVPRNRAEGHPGAGDFFLDPDGRLRRRGAAAQAPFVYTGLQLIDLAPVRDLPSGAVSLNLLWDRLLREGRLFGAVYDGRWCDVGQPESIQLAERMLADA